MLADFRLAFRQLRRTPGFTALVVTALALGIGAGTALFTIIHGALLDPLPFEKADRLVRLWAHDPTRHITRSTLSFVRVEFFRERQQSFEEIVVAYDHSLLLTGRGQAEQLPSKLVSAGFFPLFRLTPVLGRNFLAEEDRPGATPTVIVSERVWRRYFNGRADALGETLTLNGRPHTLVGVVPASFDYPYGDIDLWVTRVGDPALYTAQQVNDGAAYLNPTARLRPGVTLRAAQEELNRLVADYRREFPQRIDAITDVELLSFEEELVGQQRQAFYLLMGAVGCVHLIACLNVANLLLARFSARGRENAMRLALGASPGRLVGQFLTESLCLALAAGATGTLLAHALLRIFRFALAENLPRATDAGVSTTALGFMLGLTFVTGLLVGWFPARLATRCNLLGLLKESGRGATRGLKTGTVRRALLVAELAFSLLLLIAAGLVGLSFVQLQRIDPGFRTDGVFLAGLELPRTNYQTPAQQIAVTKEIVARVAALPNVQRVAITDSIPLSGNPILSPYAAADRPLPPVSERLVALRNIVSPEYFATLGIPVRTGRDFTATDTAESPPVVLLNEAMAKQLFPGEEAVGKKVVLGITNRTAEVIGVVGDMRTESLVLPPKPEIYFSLGQRPRPTCALVVRTADPVALIGPAVRRVLREIDPDIPLIQPRGLDESFLRSLSSQRLSLALLGLFAGTALVLAMLGVYSVMAYSVQQRRDEIGIRLLLGASPAQVGGLIVRDGFHVTLVGLGLGLGGAYFFSELLRRILYNVPPVHLPSYLALAAFLGTVSLLTCWLAARRVSQIDPIEVIRTE